MLSCLAESGLVAMLEWEIGMECFLVHLKDGLIWLQGGAPVQQDTSPNWCLSRALVHSGES